MKYSISQPVKRLDHDEKIRGLARYAADYRTDSKGRLLNTGRLVRAMIPHGTVRKINLPEFPEGYRFIGASDVPVNISAYPFNAYIPGCSAEEKYNFEHSMPLFADREIEYAGQPVGMVTGPDEKEVRRLAALCSVEADELQPVIDFMQSKELFATLERRTADTETIMMDTDDFYIERFKTGRQYHAPLETQSIIAEYDDGGVFIHGSMQCPFVVRQCVAFTLGLPEEKIRVAQDAVGGAFGGKEEFPSFLASQVAAAAYVTKSSVRVVFDRREDIQFAGKRHATYSKVRFGVKDKKITAVDVECIMDAGAYITNTPEVATRYMLTIPGVYDIPAVHVKVKMVKTNTPPCGAFRGFGNPQANFAIDMAMSHLAEQLGFDSLDFRRSYLVHRWSGTSTGGVHYDSVPLPDMLAAADRSTGCLAKRMEYAKPQNGRYRKGIGISFAMQGCSFCGAAEWEGAWVKVRLDKDAGGHVAVRTSQVEMGQGIRTALCKIAADTLGIPLSQVSHDYADTEKSYDSGPTVASRSTVVVGETVRRAAEKLRREWKDGVEQSAEAVFDTVPVKHPFSFDPLESRGDAFSHYLWAVNTVETETDLITGNIRILDAHAVYNVGTPIDIGILTGQMEGGLLQGLAYAASEKPVIGENGRMYNTSFADYHVPTAVDVPNISVEFNYDEYEGGPYGAKGAGELPAAGVPSAYLMSVEQALTNATGRETRLKGIPFTAEDAIREIVPDGAWM